MGFVFFIAVPIFVYWRIIFPTSIVYCIHFCTLYIGHQSLGFFRFAVRHQLADETACWVVFRFPNKRSCPSSIAGNFRVQSMEA